MKIDGEKNAVIFGMVIIKTLCCESTLYAVPVFDVAIVSPTVTRYLPQNSWAYYETSAQPVKPHHYIFFDIKQHVEIAVGSPSVEVCINYSYGVENLTVFDQ